MRGKKNSEYQWNKRLLERVQDHLLTKHTMQYTGMRGVNQSLLLDLLFTKKR